MDDKKKDIWFPAKKYGFGWGLPIVWQGWAVLLAYVFLTLAGPIVILQSPENQIWFWPYFLLLTVLFIFICWKKGEKAKWRWGDEDDSEDSPS